MHLHENNKKCVARQCKSVLTKFFEKAIRQTLNTIGQKKHFESYRYPGDGFAIRSFNFKFLLIATFFNEIANLLLKHLEVARL